MTREHPHTPPARLPALLCVVALWSFNPAPADDSDRIRPYAENPHYWQYKGQPVLLLGGSDQDNLFNHPDIAPDGLEAHLDLLRSVGGNTIRNTMSSRDAGNLFAFHRDRDTGLYDLDRFNDAYWQRLDNLLTLAKARDIIVQIELWDPHDYYRPVGDLGGWAQQPFNPANNVNYTFAESGMIETIDWSAVHDPDQDHPFFQTAPAERDLALVRGYQERFVDKVLEVALPYPNVLYCVSNESNDSLHWSDNWAVLAGYQLLWLEGVALANDNQLIALGDGNVNTSGSPFYHGGLVGAEYRW